MVLENWLYPGYVKQDEEEKKNMRWMLTADAIAIPVMTGIYHTAGAVIGDPNIQVSAGNDTGRMMCAALSGLVLYQHMYAAPMPSKDDMVMWRVQRRFGRWVFLTRQILALQAIHFISPYHHTTHALSTIIGGLSIFVTVQYFTLVHWSKDFLESCSVWRSKGIPFREQMLWLHVPAGFLALADVLFVKDAMHLKATLPSISTTVMAIVTYASMYVGWIHFNHSLTNEWPYGVLAPLGKSVKKWSGFVAVQSALLLSFVGISVCAVQYGR